MSPKRRSSSGMVCALLLPGLLLCAEGAPTTLTAGTRLRVEFNMPVGTAISRVNDGVEVHVLKPVLAAGREVLPLGTIVSGRVLAVRKGDKHAHTIPMLRLGFDRIRLPDGREFAAAAALADLGMMLKVDSEGAAMTEKATRGERVGGVAASGGVGAGVGGIAGGGKGAATGAAIGTGIGVLGDLATRGIEYEDFTLKKGRKAWLRLDADVQIIGTGEEQQGKATSSPNE